MALRFAGNLFLVSFALDAGLSVLDDLLRLQAQTPEIAGLSLVRQGAALFTLCQALALALVVPLTPRLPLRAFGPPIALCVWALFGALPVSLAVQDPIQRSLVVSGLQLCTAAMSFTALRFTVDGNGWLLASNLDAEPFFAPWRALGCAVAGAVFLPLLLVGAVFLQLAAAAERATNGFLHVDSEGVHIVDRDYERDGHRIRLIGMIHLGDESTYARIFDSIGEERTLVLEEGVTDREDLLADRAPYDVFAEPMGLVRQPSPSDYLHGEEEDDEEAWPHVRRHDLDTSDFSEETITYLQGIEEATRAVQARDLDALLEILRRPSMQGQSVSFVVADVLTRRDRYLGEHLSDALLDYDQVIVPWGALHQYAISKLVESWGYEQTQERRHLAIAWSDVARKMLAADASAP